MQRCRGAEVQRCWDGKGSGTGGEVNGNLWMAARLVAPSGDEAVAHARPRYARTYV